MPSWDQISGGVDRVLLVLASWAVGRGLISQADAAQYVVLAVGVLGAFYGWWVNRPQAIVQSAAAIPNTTVVTTPDLAAATPEKNIVSNATTKVVNK